MAAVVGFAFLGIGAVLFLAMFGLLVTRLALRPRQLPQLAPSLWIPLAPAGILGFALLRLLQAGQAAGVEGFTSDTAGVIVASMGIGLGLWWALFAGLETLRLRRDGGVPFHPGWWGYVFPARPSPWPSPESVRPLDSTVVLAAGAVATVVVLLVWLLVAVRTVRLVRVSAGSLASRAGACWQVS